MAEALALIGLISNVVQFVEMGHRFIDKFREAHSSAQGATAENAQIESDVQAVKLLVENVETRLDDSLSQGVSQGAKKQLRDFLVAWNAVATRLLQFLEDHKVKNTDRYRPLQALKEAWRLEVGRSAKEKVRTLREGLNKLQSMILLCLTAIIRDEQSAIARDIGKIKAQNESMKAKTLTKLDTIQANLGSLLSRVPSQDLKDPGKNAPNVLDSLSAELLQLLKPELQALSDETESVLRQHQLLRSLWFKTIRLRRSSIRVAYENTFKWALSGSHDFARWLQSGQGIFWVRGKAGSGKSTLMRFLSEQEQNLTSQHLAHWTKGQDLVIASHYFWYAGNSLQKSQVGLLRTLLYEIFRQCPELMKLTCPNILVSITDHAEDLWTEASLLEVFGSISQVTAISKKFCFFIDGLDEFTGGEDKYHGSYEELISVLVRLSQSPHIKICVSSRPWTPFEAAFGDGHAQLRLESLTRSDIEGYVRDRFMSNNEFQSVVKSSNHRPGTEAVYQALIKDIVTRAQGVFLWVSLVVSSLLKGMQIHADNVHDLQNRLNEFPDDLDEFYTRMLETIEPVYLTESVRIFQTSIDADQPLPALAYEFLHHEKSTPNYALHYSQSNMDQIMLKTPKEIRTRLNARCKDLLEVVENSDEKSFMRYQVDFHHRTVRDFLKGTTVVSDIMRKRRIADFDSLLSLCKMMLALIKNACFESKGTQPDINQFFSLTDNLMHYCRKIETQCIGQPQYHDEVPLGSRIIEMCEILDELDHTGIKYMNAEKGYHWTNTRDAPKGTFQEYQQSSFIGATIQARLFFYLKTQLDKDATCIQKRGRPLLDYALRPTIVTPIELRDIEIGPVIPVVKLLLQRGADPNHEIYIYDKQTPWVLFLRTCYDHAGRAQRQGTSSSSETAKSVVSRLSSTEIYSAICLLLGSQADPDVYFQGSRNKPVGIMETMEICKFSRGEVEEVRRLMSVNRQIRSQRVGWIPWARSVLGR